MGNCAGKEQNIPTSKIIPHIFKEHYKVDKTLGSGGLATVKLATHRENNNNVAVKVIRKENLLDVDDIALHQEVEILRSLDHPNIVKCLDFFDEERHYYIILEYMAGGELLQRIVQRKSYNENDARDVVKSVLHAIKYCHDRNIVHRDLKPENLLLATPDSETDLKVADFGFASKHGDFMKTQLGTPAYTAPEILECKPYDKAVDMWSIGVISYMVLAGYPPFQDNNLRALFRKIRKGIFVFPIEDWETVSDEAKDFINCLLVVDPSKRYTTDQALEHPWLKVDSDSLSRRSLENNLKSFKVYLSRRKFRSAVLTVMAIKKMQNLAKHEEEKETVGDEILPETPSEALTDKDKGIETRAPTKSSSKMSFRFLSSFRDSSV